MRKVRRMLAMGLLVSACGYGTGTKSGTAPVAQAPEPPPPPTATAAPRATPTAVLPGHELVVWALAHPDHGKRPLSVNFDVNVWGDTGELKFLWTFGDGSKPSTERSPHHVYKKPGSYTAKVKVVDSTGLGGTDEAEIAVYTPEDYPL